MPADVQSWRIGIFFGSTNGATAHAAQRIADAFSTRTGAEIELLDIAEVYLEEMLDFDLLVAGVSTWNTGQLQRDWDDVIDEFGDLDLAGKPAALFGLGDQVGYPDTFGDAVYFIADKLRSCGARLIGRWPTGGYHFRSSWAVEEDAFIGLMLDEDNQAGLTEPRIHAWVEQVILEARALLPVMDKE